MTEVRRPAKRLPRSLTPDQLADLDVTIAAHPSQVRAWVTWDDGVEQRVDAHAIAWTRRAVQVRFGIPPRVFEVWVWAGAVERVDPESG